MEKELYPVELEELDLNFTDAVFAIAFDLADEIRQNQEEKDAILDHFGATKTRAETVKPIIAKMHISENRALQRVLGDLGPNGDEKVFHEYSTLKDNFRDAISKLRTPETRFALLGSPTWETKDDVVVEPKAEVSDNAEMYARVSQLMAEVRLYDQKRDEALSEIQELLGRLVEMGFKEASKLKEDTPEPKIATESKPEISLDGPITQLDWSYRSLKVLNERGLSSVCLAVAVEFFGDFQNFVDDGKISLREWAVITSTLRRAGLFEDTGGDDLLIETTDTSIEEFRLDRKRSDCLKRRNIRDIDDIMRVFADGYHVGLARMKKIRGFGEVSWRKFLLKLATCRFCLDIDECTPRKSSAVRYLDFNREYDIYCFINEKLQIIQDLNIRTIGQLVSACCDQRRFHNLKDIDQEAYELAVDHLRKYGFTV